MTSNRARRTERPRSRDTSFRVSCARVKLEDFLAPRLLRNAHVQTIGIPAWINEQANPDSTVPMSEDEELAMVLKTRPGIETLTPKQQEELRNAHDIQLDRATDFLHGYLIFAHRSPNTQKVAGKGGKEVAAYEQ